MVIGGDGSLTGANLFRQEWASLLKELTENGACWGWGVGGGGLAGWMRKWEVAAWLIEYLLVACL